MKKIILMIIIFLENGFANSDFGGKGNPIQLMTEQIIDSNLFSLVIITAVSMTVFSLLKFLSFQLENLSYSNVKTTKNKIKVNEEPIQTIKKDDLINLNILKEELLFIINLNLRSQIVKERINDLIKDFEKRYKENLNILNNLKINIEEKMLATSENEKILLNIKELISTTKIKKEEFNIEENTEEIKKYLNILNTTR